MILWFSCNVVLCDFVKSLHLHCICHAEHTAVGQSVSMEARAVVRRVSHTQGGSVCVCVCGRVFACGVVVWLGCGGCGAVCEGVRVRVRVHVCDCLCVV